MKLTNFVKSQIQRFIQTQQPVSSEPVTFEIIPYPPHSMFINAVNEPIAFYPIYKNLPHQKKTKWVWAYYEFRGERVEIVSNPLGF
jgi:hypothetical protein